MLASFALGTVLMQGPMLRPLLFNGAVAPTAEDYARAQRNFVRWWNAPPTIKTLLHTDIALLTIALASKFAHWTEEAFFFDGACLRAYRYGGPLTRTVCIVGILALYVAVVVPGLQTVTGTSLSSDSLVTRFISSGYGQLNATLPALDEGQVQQSLAVTGAAIVIIAGLLTTIIFLQAGEFYAVEVVQARLQLEWEREEKLRIANEQSQAQGRLKAE